ncbi:kinase-like domain-containing protein [Mycena epipterygia]|nr:kinase-like domain-containing protein [Mycena epipterygia]
MPTRENSPLDDVAASCSPELPTSILIYSNSLAFMQECSARNPGCRSALNDYSDLTSAENVIDGLVHSSKRRKKLIELASKFDLTRNPNFREALYADEEQIATWILSVLNSNAGQTAVLKLEGDEAQNLLDVIQTTLDKGFLLTADHSSKAHKMMQKLSVLSNKLPSDLFINVTECEEHPVSGGTFSNIYKAFYNTKTVELKVMRTFHQGSALHAFRSKFYQEALIWQNLCHPNILPLLGVDQESFSPSLGMILPWMEHGSVVQYLGKQGRGHVNEILLEIAQGLQYLHSKNIVHGDLRGANVLINDEPRACLADFGLSFLADASLEHTPERVGGLRWMAPELIDPDSFGCQFSHTKASDVYAFGCVFLELYTGQPSQVSQMSLERCLQLWMANLHYPPPLR